MGTNTTLFKIGAIAIVIQNALWLAGIFVDPSLAEYVLYIDIVGFLLLGLGYLLTSVSEGQGTSYLLGGILVLGWVVARVMWQFVLVGNLFNSISDPNADYTTLLEDLINTFFDMIYAFLISAICLLLASFFIWRVASSKGLIFFIYGIINFIGVFLFVNPFLGTTSDAEVAVNGLIAGFFIKALVVPILGIIFFLMMFRSADDHLTAKM